MHCDRVTILELIILKKAEVDFYSDELFFAKYRIKEKKPGSIGPVVVNVNLWPSEITSACKIRPTSKGSGA